MRYRRIVKRAISLAKIEYRKIRMHNESVNGSIKITDTSLCNVVKD